MNDTFASGGRGRRPAWRLVASVCLAAHLAGCGIAPRSSPAMQFDLGPAPAASAPGLPALPPVSIADIGVPNWLDRPLMYYRLNYDNPMQPRPYASSRWTMAPAELIEQRLKQRIVSAGGIALSASDGASNVPVIRIETDDFIQVFDAPGRSAGQVTLRASVYRGRSLLGQKTVARTVPAPTPDASGGARALAEATDAACRDLIVWLGSLPLQAAGAQGAPAGR
ncbi:ABC-type transport auxiliary lipoprotein family protein [Noviherbaspirillum galbum]|uniref:ABC transporter n=1 Tax=Noviherbaspirillum galbum TaxID=2709383 RepID=A0A6B3SLN1_9BURK|nr:ABC-type transport auxiliary lipoprotein family protein [Noviherbaspirillum galbum]NEX61388.1 ABC transporter [Noviherbaspirillum galbum]